MIQVIDAFGIACDLYQNKIGLVLLHPHFNMYDCSADELIDFISGWDHLLMKRGCACAERLYRQALQEQPGDEDLVETYPIFLALKLKMDEHIRKEAYILFPYARNVLGNEAGVEGQEMLSVGLLRNPLLVIEGEHAAMLEMLAELRRGFRNFLWAAGDERKKRMLVGELLFLEQTLHGHAHVQQNILFPKLMEAEDRIIKRMA